MVKRVRKRVYELAENLYLLRLDDNKTKYFEAIWPIPEGVTYNSYLLLTGEGAILFDSWKHSYAEDFIETLEEVVDPIKVKYIVVHHMEEDHSSALPRVLEEIGSEVTIVGHPLTRTMLEAFYGARPRFKPIRDGEKISLAGKVIKFVHTPWLHWPETIMSYLENEGVLLSGDAFGGFSIPSMFDDEREGVAEYVRYVRKYIATVIGRYSSFVLKAVDKLKASRISPRIIAPAHGMVFRKNPEFIIDLYVRLARKEAEKGKVLVVYASMYGSVERAVLVAVEHLRALGFKPVIYRFTDIEQAPIGDVLSDAIDAEALIVGAPTYEGDVFPSVKYFLELLGKKIGGRKTVLVISSYGWGGVAGRKIAEVLGAAGFKVAGILEFRGMPRLEDFERLKSLVRELVTE